MQQPDTELQVYPATPERWDDLLTLFGKTGACDGCWCMFWRLRSSEWFQRRRAEKREALQALVEEGRTPGLLAYENGRPIGWCAVAPREEYVRIERSRKLKPVDDRPVWAVPCFFVDRNHRGRGVAEALLHAAVQFAAEHGAEVIEGYPVGTQERINDGAAYTGTLAMFLRAGFREVARPPAGFRVIVRRNP